MSVKDIENAMFTYDKKMHNTYIVSLEKVLQFIGSRFAPSDQLSLEAGQVVVHKTMEPKDIAMQNEFN